MQFNPSINKRTRIYERDDYQCWYCGIQLSKDRTIQRGTSIFVQDLMLLPTIDHLVPRISGGYDTDENLVTACRKCNSQKGKKTVEEYRDYLAKQQDSNIRAIKHIESALDEVETPFDEDLRETIKWLRGEVVSITFYGEQKTAPNPNPQEETPCKATSLG